MDMVAIIIQYTLVFASVLAIVGLGGMFSERSGVINLGLEGTMVIGALGGALTMRFLPTGTNAFLVVFLVILVSIIAGVLYSLLLSLATITFKADQTITGTALNILAPALATVIVKAVTLNQDGKATPKLDYTNLQSSFVFKMSEINVSRIIPTILLLAGVIILLYTLKSKTLNKNNKLIGYIVSGSLGIVSILFIILFATKVLGVVTFDWGLFIILILISAYKITKLAFEFKDKKKVKVKEIIVASIFLLLTILVMVLSLTGFFNSLTMNWFIPIMIVLVCIAYFVLYKTKFGLRLMACGENPAAADAVGINVTKMRYIGVCISGCLAGIGGIAFIASVNSSWSFDVGVSGFGFLALAVMIFGQWKPINIMLGATLFGFFRAIGLTYVVIPFLSNMNLNPTWYSMLPYIVCLIVLAFTSRKSRAPKAEGIPYDKATR
jgi:ABC-type uncharacterized transport system permease subunit